MRQTQFFRTLNRLKTLLSLVLGFILLLLLLYAGYEIIKSKFIPRQVSDMVNVAPKSQVQAKWSLGGFESLGGSEYLIAPVYSLQTYRPGYYEKDTSAVRNYLFVNAADKSSRWLVPTNGALILTMEKLIETNIPPKSEVVKGLWYTLVKTDTNQDERLTADDLQTVAISKPTGEGYTELLQNVEQVLGSTFRNGNTLLVFHRTNQRHFVSEINLAERRLTSTQELAKIPSQ